MKSPLAHVISNWHTSLPAFNTSAMAFYEAVEQALARQNVPQLKASRRHYPEQGVGSAKREYLRLERREIAFDVCAAPFGTSFFFSWWLQQRSPRRLWAVGVLAALAALVAFVNFRSPYQLLVALGRDGAEVVVFFALLITAVTVLLILARIGIFGPVPIVLAIPFLGPLYNFIFRPLTFYRLDTMYMFQRAVHAAVLEAIDGLTATHGLRALSPDERRPAMPEFGVRALVEEGRR